MCQNYLGHNAIQVLDPTMLLSKDVYINILKSGVTKESNGNLFCYILDKNPQKENLIKNVSSELKLIPFSVSIENFQLKRYTEASSQPSVEQWLRSFYDSKFIITDSFHACVFSILFNKPFLALGNANRGITRFSSLLSTFNLERRLIVNLEDKIQLMEKLHENINYNQVNEVLLQKRDESILFLKKALK